MTNIEKWLFYNDSIESPDIFIHWTWFLTISAALQRRVSLFGPPNVDHITSQIYANQFVVFIAPPSIGKTIAAREASQMFRALSVVKTKPNGEIEREEVIKTGPSSITVQQLYRYLALNHTVTDLSAVKPNPSLKGKVYIHASLAFFCGSELGNLIETNSDGLVSFLTEAWECGDFHRETKTQGIDIIPKLCVTLLGAATPAWIQEVTKNKLLKQGFSARTIFLYADTKRKLTHKFSYNAAQIAARLELIEHLRKLTQLCGEVTIAPDAEEFIKTWYETGGSKPLNTDKRLADYYGRKKLHLYKLAMAVHFSESTDMVITLPEVKLALSILTNAEISMHKALSFGGENPCYAMAQDALRLIESAGNVSFNKLLMELYDLGDKDQLIAAMQYLVDTEQVKQTAGTKGLKYEVRNAK